MNPRSSDLNDPEQIAAVGALGRWAGTDTSTEAREFREWLEQFSAEVLRQTTDARGALWARVRDVEVGAHETLKRHQAGGAGLEEVRRAVGDCSAEYERCLRAMKAKPGAKR